ncbi:hypothetical protein ICN46_00120 [Polynucleobacter sp. Latsch14-2]|jgi:hypothetical protein|uniref:hypothetical protein n=1 Tax=Polynucleobacter sp. Latsch14-2 TaxID=2576920 RepID=UPI001C0B4368|nr:hypothetical protein [Polynucleobacter sp. Latsch14-2]MBU3613300.1 hypothetical protein [Polynucleobacter sp. Latsch14-2]
METVLENVKNDSAVSHSLLDHPKVKISSSSPDPWNDLNQMFDSMSKSAAESITPEMVEAKDTAIELALNECLKLTSEHNKFYDLISAAHDTLYQSLADIYAFVLRVQLSEYKQHIKTAMISNLMDKGVKIQSNTSDLMVIIKTIIGADRRRASEYCRVLEVAMRENLTPKDLPSYIKLRGGVSAIYSTESELVAKKLGEKEREFRTSYFQELFEIRHWANKSSFSTPIKVIQNSDEIDCNRAKFTVFLTLFDKKEQVYKICSAHNLGEKQERNFIKHITRDIHDTNEVLKEKLFAYRSKLVELKLVPDVLQKIWGQLKMITDKTTETVEST